MKKILLVALILALSLGQSILDKHLKEKTFLNYSKRYNKKYGSLEESLFRFSVYKDNLKSIDEQNKRNKRAVFAENKFSDLTNEEFLARYTGVNLPTNIIDEREREENDDNINERNLQALPASLDLRETEGIQPIRYQGSCGSCWAFASVATIEYAHWKNTNTTVDLSEQHLVDCTYTNKTGCNGGWMYDAYAYIAKSGGLAYESDYNYTYKYSGSCLSATVKDAPKVKLNKTKSYIWLGSSDNSIKTALNNVGVLSVCVDATWWQSYKSGIFQDYTFIDQTKSPKCTHAVAIVGYGTENNIPYYIIRNSWDTWWGENGYMRMDARRYENKNTYSGLMPTYTFQPVLS